MSLLRSSVGDAMYAVSRRFSGSYGGLGSRLALSAAVLPDLVAPPPGSASAVVIPSVATAGLRPGAPALQEAVLSALRNAGFSAAPFAASGGPAFPTLHSGCGLVLLGIVAGAAVYSIEDGDGFLLSKEPGDSGGGKPPVRPGAVVGGGSGSGGDHDRYLLLLKLLFAMCQGDDDEESRNNFQQLKRLMLRDWFELHQRREALNAEEIIAETENENNHSERERVNSDLQRVKDALCEIERREQIVKDNSLRTAGDTLKLKEERAEIVEKLRVAGLVEKELENEIYRVGLSAQTVYDIWKDVHAEQSKMAAADPDGFMGNEGCKEGASSDGKGQGKADGPKKEDKSAWSKVLAVLNFPAKVNGLLRWSFDTVYFFSFGASLAALLPKANMSTLETVIELYKGKQRTDQAEIDGILAAHGLKKE